MTRHIPIFDGLRGLAAIAVLVLHCLGEVNADAAIPHGALAVDFFFMLSGFVIALAYEHKIGSLMTIATFLKVRFIRLYPMICLGMIMGAAVFLAKYVQHPANFQLPQFLTNLVLGLVVLPSPLPPMDGWDGIYPLDGAAWSLFFEIIANVIFVVVANRLNNRLLMALTALGAIFLLVQAYALGGVTGGMYWAGMDRFLGFRGDPLFLSLGMTRVFFPFSVGILLFRFDADILRKQYLKVPGFLAVALFIAALACPNPGQNWLFESLIVIIVFPVVLMLARLSNPVGSVKTLYLWFGRISYPLYLVHAPIIHLFGHYEREHDMHGSMLVIALVTEIVACIGIAQLSYTFVDVPARAWLSNKLLYPRTATPN